MRVWLRIFLVMLVNFILLPSSLSAQTQLAVLTGITGSVNMGDIGPAPVFQGTFTIGNRLRLENGFKFSSLDKYTRAGWYLKDHMDIIVFPSNSGFFLVGGVDYGYRNGGDWSKDGIKLELGGGYETRGAHYTHYRFYIKNEIMSRNDNVRYSPFFELLAREDYPLGRTHWRFRTEAQIGTFQYTQNEQTRIAFYSSALLGFVYKWP